MDLRLRSNEASRALPRKPAGRRVFCRLPTLARSLQPVLRMFHGQSGTDPPWHMPKSLSAGPHAIFRQALLWLDRNLKLADEVSIRIVKSAPIDQPRRRRRFQRPKALRILQFEKGLVMKLARKFGWKILKPKTRGKKERSIQPNQPASI